MTESTEGLQRTAFIVGTDERSTLPVWTQVLRIVVEKMGFAAEILPVMSVDAFCFVMVLVLEGAPLGLEVEHVKMGVVCVFMDQSGLQV